MFHSLLATSPNTRSRNFSNREMLPICSDELTRSTSASVFAMARDPWTTRCFERLLVQGMTLTLSRDVYAACREMHRISDVARVTSFYMVTYCWTLKEP
jgi:hypothetical protein